MAHSLGVDMADESAAEDSDSRERSFGSAAALRSIDNAAAAASSAGAAAAAVSASGAAKPKPPRLKSLDTFRGFSLTVMIFVNLGGGGYW